MSKPILKRKDRRFQVSIFENIFEDKKLHTASIQYSYRNRDGGYTNNELHVNLSDLLVLANLCQKTYNDLRQQVEDKKTSDISFDISDFNN
jgi:hypothetical protein